MTPTEINRRVAEICGLECRVVEQPPGFEDGSPAEVYIPVEKPPEHNPRITLRPFNPYHDANDALWAAERVGKMGVELGGLSKQHHVEGGKWRCELDLPQHPTDQGRPSHLAELHTTASGAICLAILALKGVPA